MRRLKVSLTKNELLRQELDCLPWELPLMQLVHGENNVQELGEEYDDGQPLPSAETEYARLDARYGIDRDSKQRRIASVYGLGAAGVKKLAKAMGAKASKQETHEAPDDEGGDDGAEAAADEPRPRYRRSRSKE
jgi:hypothetical protein